MKKRGQITIFVIVAIVIVVIVGLFIFLKGDDGIGGIGGDDVPSTPEGVEFKVYMDECLKDVLEQGFMLAGYQGGYVIVSDSLDSKDFFGASVPYYSVDGESRLPSRNTLLRSVEDYVSFGIVQCKDEFESNYELISEGVNNVDINFEDDLAKVYVNYPVSLVLGDTTSEVSSFTADSSVRFNNVYDTVASIIALQNKDPYNICFNCVNVLNRDNIFVDGFAQSGNTIVFLVSDLGAELVEDEYYKFYFAVKYPEYNCENLPGDIDDYVKEQCGVEDV